MEIKEAQATVDVPEKNPVKQQKKTTTKEANKSVELHAIEELAVRLNTPKWALEGAKVAYGWGGGKKLSEAEYRNAINRFVRGPLSR